MDDLDEVKAELVDLALQIGQNEGKLLDFSPESVRDVEAILGAMHDYYRETKNAEGLFGIALEFGAYLIEVIERHYPPRGRWHKDDPELGSDTFPYDWQSVTIFPVAWCQKRIFEGPAEDVVSKFQTFVVNRKPDPTA